MRDGLQAKVPHEATVVDWNEWPHLTECLGVRCDHHLALNLLLEVFLCNILLQQVLPVPPRVLCGLHNVAFVSGVRRNRQARGRDSGDLDGPIGRHMELGRTREQRRWVFTYRRVRYGDDFVGRSDSSGSRRLGLDVGHNQTCCRRALANVSQNVLLRRMRGWCDGSETGYGGSGHQRNFAGALVAAKGLINGNVVDKLLQTGRNAGGGNTH